MTFWKRQNYRAKIRSWFPGAECRERGLYISLINVSSRVLTSEVTLIFYILKKIKVNSKDGREEPIFKKLVEEQKT